MEIHPSRLLLLSFQHPTISFPYPPNLAHTSLHMGLTGLDTGHHDLTIETLSFGRQKEEWDLELVFQLSQRLKHKEFASWTARLEIKCWRQMNLCGCHPGNTDSNQKALGLLLWPLNLAGLLPNIYHHASVPGTWHWTPKSRALGRKLCVRRFSAKPQPECSVAQLQAIAPCPSTSRANEKFPSSFALFPWRYL